MTPVSDQSRTVYFVNQYGWPDGAATAQLLCDVLSDAPDRYKIVLIQGTSMYAEVAGSRPRPPVEIRKVWVPRADRGSLALKIVGFVCFYVQVLILITLRSAGSDVVVLTTPPFLNWIGALAKRVRGGRLIVWEMDVYPDILFTSGLVSRTSVLGSMVNRASKWARCETDFTLVLGRCMAERVIGAGISADKCAELQNWADGNSLCPVRVPGTDPKLVLLYSGNFGMAHDSATLLEAIKLLRHMPVEFVFAGGGIKMVEFRSCDTAIVRFRPACAYNELNSVLNSADVGIVTQTQDSVGCVVPSKFYGILAAGRSVLYVGPANSTVACVIRETGCGWIVPIGDCEGLAALVHNLMRDRTLVRKAGERARGVFEERFTRTRSVARFWDLMSDVKALSS